MRLIDLHVDWLLQYSSETTAFDPALYADVGPRLGQIQGYLQTTRAAIFSCSRSSEDWKSRVETWSSLDPLITWLEAEFPGRLLIGPDDFDRFLDDRDGLTWGLIGLPGLDWLVRTTGDLDRLPALFARGVRVFQPIEREGSPLGGSLADPAGTSGLSELGTRLLNSIESLALPVSGPRPLIDLWGMGPSTLVDALNWFEAEPDHPRRSIPFLSRYSTVPDGSDSPNGVTPEMIQRFRALGGYIGLDLASDSFETPAQIKEVVDQLASIPFQGRVGLEGIGISTRFLTRDRTLPGLGMAEEVARWFQAQFDRASAKDLVHDNGLALISLALGVDRLR